MNEVYSRVNNIKSAVDVHRETFNQLSCNLYNFLKENEYLDHGLELAQWANNYYEWREILFNKSKPHNRTTFEEAVVSLNRQFGLGMTEKNALQYSNGHWICSRSYSPTAGCKYNYFFFNENNKNITHAHIYFLAIVAAPLVPQVTQDPREKFNYTNTNRHVRIDYLILGLTKKFESSAESKYLLSRCSDVHCFNPSHRAYEGLETNEQRRECVVKYWELPEGDRATKFFCSHSPQCLLHPIFGTRKELERVFTCDPTKRAKKEHTPKSSDIMTTPKSIKLKYRLSF